MFNQKIVSFGEFIRNLRETAGLSLRNIAQQLEIDPSLLAKIERNERKANFEFIEKISKIFDVNKRELLVIFHSDKVAYDLFEEDFGKEVLRVAEKKIIYFKKNKK